MQQTANSVTTKPINSSNPGHTVLLQQGDIITTSTFVNVGCFQGSLKTTGNNTAAFLTTYADYQAMYKYYSYPIERIDIGLSRRFEVLTVH